MENIEWLDFRESHGSDNVNVMSGETLSRLGTLLQNRATYVILGETDPSAQLIYREGDTIATQFHWSIDDEETKTIYWFIGRLNVTASSVGFDLYEIKSIVIAQSPYGSNDHIWEGVFVRGTLGAFQKFWNGDENLEASAAVESAARRAYRASSF